MHSVGRMAPEDRERATGLLYTLTVWVGAVAAGLVGVFAGIAAVTVPGASDATASTVTGSSDTGGLSDPGQVAPTPEPVQQVQPPVNAPVAAPPDLPHARSGGSSHR